MSEKYREVFYGVRSRSGKYPYDVGRSRPRLRDRAYSPDGVTKWTVFKRYNVWWVFAPGPLGGVINERDSHYKTYEKALEHVVAMIDSQ